MSALTGCVDAVNSFTEQDVGDETEKKLPDCGNKCLPSWNNAQDLKMTRMSQTRQHGPLGSHSPQHENIGSREKCYGFTLLPLCVCVQEKRWKKASHRAQRNPAAAATPGEIST